jgi:hypothetical protein
MHTLTATGSCAKQVQGAGAGSKEASKPAPGGRAQGAARAPPRAAYPVAAPHAALRPQVLGLKVHAHAVRGGDENGVGGAAQPHTLQLVALLQARQGWGIEWGAWAGAPSCEWGAGELAGRCPAQAAAGERVACYGERGLSRPGHGLKRFMASAGLEATEVAGVRHHAMQPRGLAAPHMHRASFMPPRPQLPGWYPAKTSILYEIICEGPGKARQPALSPPVCRTQVGLPSTYI